MHMSNSWATSNFACNSRFSLPSCTYNLMAEVRTSNSNQYSQPWLVTHVVTIGENKSQIPTIISQAYGILLDKVSI